LKSQTLGDMNTNVQYDKPMPSKEKMKTGDCCGNRPGFLDQDLKSSRGKNRFRGIVDPDLESSRKVYRVRGFVDQEWKSSRKIYRVRGIVDQDEESSTGSEDLSTRSETSSTGSEDSSTRSETSSTGSKYLIFFWNRCLLRHFNVCWCQEGKGL